MTVLTDFSWKVIKLIKAIPRGKVATYGQIAKLAGNPRGSRTVSWLLHACTKTYKLPWQRVINSKGRISFHEASMAFSVQKRLLIKEGIAVENGRVDLKKYLWRKK